MASRVVTVTPASRIGYGSDRRQFGELTLPEGEAPSNGWPVAVVLHGGFWRLPHGRRLMRKLSASVAGLGIATWNLEYRRVGRFGGGGWPTTFDDVATGTDHLTRLASAEPLDPDRVVGIGHSAGGHLVLWLAARPRLPGPPPAIRLRGALSLAGVADLAACDRLGLGGGAAAVLMGGSADRVPVRYALGSPAALLPLGVPQRLVHGTFDDAVPISMSREYAERARRSGDDVRLSELDSVGHMALIEPAEPVWPVVRDQLLDLVGRT